jgi:hypothetical protein
VTSYFNLEKRTLIAIKILPLTLIDLAFYESMNGVRPIFQIAYATVLTKTFKTLF